MSADDVFLSETDTTLDDVGLIGESEAAQRFGGEQVGNDQSTPDWVDVVLEDDLVVDGELVATESTPVQVKMCAWRVRDQRSRRQGRWMIHRDELETLIDKRGLLALGVYDARATETVVLDVFFPGAIASLGLTWCDNGHGREAARLRWGRVFSSEHVDATRRAILASRED